MDISVIIPVYNCEEYIEECLDSVCGQTMKNLEIICIDDGSTDRSYNILSEYKKKDNRIVLLKQSNMGAGAARNRGLEKANGKFVCFLDADDYYIDKNALERLYNTCIEKNVKVCGSIFKLLKKNVIIDDTIFDVLKTRSNEILDYTEFQYDYRYQGFLFLRELLVENNIKFPMYRRFQDPPFFVKAMFYAQKFAFSETALYCYRLPAKARTYSKVKVRDMLKGLRDNLVFAKENHLDILFYKTKMRLEYEYCYTIYHWIDVNDMEEIQLLKEIQELIREKLNENIYELRPLTFIMNKNNISNQSYEDYLIAEIQNHSYMYIYGAGKLAKKFIFFLKNKNLLHKVKGIVVSENSAQANSIEGIEVKAVEEIRENKEVTFYIATGGIFHKEIIEKLEEYNFNNAVTLDTIFLEEIEVKN